MTAIVLDESRDVEMSEVEREYRQRGHDIMTGRHTGSLALPAPPQ